MPSMELDASDIQLLAKAKQGPVYRGLFGWPINSMIGPMRIQHMVDYGYLQFIYDWGKDRPAVRITSLGDCRLREELERDVQIVRGVDIRV
jgi:hypothetical protein